MKLVNPTDRDLNWTFLKVICKKSMSMVLDVPPFTESADLVLPWLEKLGAYVSLRYWNGEWADPPGWYLSLWENDENGPQIGEYVGDMSFARAAVIALLRAHGVEIEFIKETN